MNEPKKVVVAMSGGVDSSVAAALLVEQGYEVVGMMLRLWSEEGKEASNRCCTPDAMAQARRVAAQLGIPFYAVDAQAPFRAIVVEAFLQGYASGTTPNPCVFCNRQVRWGTLMKQALALGADFMATGHYARLRRHKNGTTELLSGLDPQKDQSYVLSALNQQQLSQTLFPLGELTKLEVREIARRYRLSAAERPDSQDLCFLAGDDYRDFLKRHLSEAVQPGAIVNTQGDVLGKHDGLAFYTIGQRKGLGISSAKPMYVIEKQAVGNTLVVGSAAELGRSELYAGELNWISGEAPGIPTRVQVKIRYKAKMADASLSLDSGGRAFVQFDQPLRDITPGQRAVFYQGELVLGGGTIQE